MSRDIVWGNFSGQKNSATEANKVGQCGGKMAYRQVPPPMPVSVPVRLQKKENTHTPYGSRRHHVATIFFREGTKAGHVCRRVMERQQTTTGVWLLQIKLQDIEDARTEDEDDSAYLLVRDPNYTLKRGIEYSALYYNGPTVIVGC